MKNKIEIYEIVADVINIALAILSVVGFSN